jgi:hypothetical protein
VLGSLLAHPAMNLKKEDPAMISGLIKIAYGAVKNEEGVFFNRSLCEQLEKKLTDSYTLIGHLTLIQLKIRFYSKAPRTLTQGSSFWRDLWTLQKSLFKSYWDPKEYNLLTKADDYYAAQLQRISQIPEKVEVSLKEELAIKPLISSKNNQNSQETVKNSNQPSN